MAKSTGMNWKNNGMMRMSLGAAKGGMKTGSRMTGKK